jgi:hypothetical protein
VWLRFKGRVGGFTDVDVDKVLTDSSLSFNTRTETRNAGIYDELRRYPDSILRRVRRPSSFFSNN